MPRLVAIIGGKVANIAFNVNDEPSRAKIDQALIDEWDLKYGETALVDDNELRIEIDDDWDGKQGAEPLEVRRLRMIGEINQRTRAIILDGYEWPAGSGIFFSLSDTAQRNLADLDVNKDVLVTYPWSLSTKDDLGMHPIKDSKELHDIYLTSIVKRGTAYVGGNALKELVRAAASHADLDVIVDDRE
jgi:hypothetical protein